MSKAEEILQAVKAGYGEKLYWHIRRMVVSHDDAEDALQETFIKIFTKAHTFKGGSLESVASQFVCLGPGLQFKERSKLRFFR